jgi:hypothetical protein
VTGEGRPRLRLRLRLGLAAALAGLSVLSSALPAMAAGEVSTPIGLTPLQVVDGHLAQYFAFNVAPGHSVTGDVLISNPSHTTRKLKISRSAGATAANGGTFFSQTFQRCAGPGCWVTGLPATVTLAPETGEKLQFTVTVPRGTAPGQYLAGLTTEAAAKPKPVKIGSKGNPNATGRVIIIDQVTVAVAVTVGTMSELTTRLQIPRAYATLIGTVVRLNIDLANTGQTFAHGTGTASCGPAGRPHTYRFYASTVLPHERALIAANLQGLAVAGAAVPCTVRINYGRRQTVSWSGLVTVPAASASRVVRTGLGSYSVIPVGGIPAWATALIVIGVLLLAAAVVLFVRLHGRRPADETGSNTELQYEHRE